MLKKRDGKQPTPFCGTIRGQFYRHWSLMVQQLWDDDAAAMGVDDRSFAFLTKTICRIEAGAYDRDLERQTCGTSGHRARASTSHPLRVSKDAFRGHAAWIRWPCLVLSLNRRLSSTLL